MYNDTNITSANTVYEIVKSFNDLSGGLFLTLVFLVLCLTWMIVFKKQDFKKVFFAGGFFASVIAILLFFLGFVSQDFLIAPIVVFFAGLIALLINKE